MSIRELLCDIVFHGGSGLVQAHVLSMLYAGVKEGAGFAFFLKGFMKAYNFWWGRVLLFPEEVAHVYVLTRVQ